MGCREGKGGSDMLSFWKISQWSHISSFGLFPCRALSARDAEHVLREIRTGLDAALKVPILLPVSCTNLGSDFSKTPFYLLVLPVRPSPVLFPPLWQLARSLLLLFLVVCPSTSCVHDSCSSGILFMCCTFFAPSTVSIFGCSSVLHERQLTRPCDVCLGGI